MEINENQKKKIVSIWTSNSDSAAALQSAIDYYKTTGYRIAVFHSGDSSLEQCVSQLLVNNT